MKHLVIILCLLPIVFLASCMGAEDSSGFLQLRVDERRERILDYSLKRQVDMYLEAMMAIHPPDLALADVIAKHGVDIVPILKNKIAAEEGFAVVCLVDVFIRMQEFNYYQARKDVELMTFLNVKIGSMRDKGWKSVAADMIEKIKTIKSREKGTSD